TNAPQVTASSFDVSVFPTLVNDQFNVKVTSSVNNDISFSLLDVNGNICWNSEKKNLYTGVNSFQFLLNEIKLKKNSDGVFFLKISSGNESVTKKIVAVQ